VAYDGKTVERPGYGERIAQMVGLIWPQHTPPYAVLSAVAHAELPGLTRSLSDPGDGLDPRPDRRARRQIPRLSRPVRRAARLDRGPRSSPASPAARRVAQRTRAWGEQPSFAHRVSRWLGPSHITRH